MLKGVAGLPIIMLLLGMVSAIVIVVFALQNGRVVSVSFFDWNVEASLVLVIMVSALMGFLTAIFFEMFIQIKLRYRLFKANRQLKKLEEEIHMMRTAKVPSNPAIVAPAKEVKQKEGEAPSEYNE